MVCVRLQKRWWRGHLASVGCQTTGRMFGGIMFIGREGFLILTFSICAKCGSTSLYGAIFEALYGYQYNLSGPPWVQDWMNWPQNGRPSGSLLLYAGHLENLTITASSTWHFYHIYRDPVDRYISAFFSKLRCCDPKRVRVSTSGLNRSSCMRPCAGPGQWAGTDFACLASSLLSEASLPIVRVLVDFRPAWLP